MIGMTIDNAWNFITDEENASLSYVDKLQRLLFFGINKELANLMIICQENDVSMTPEQLTMIDEVYA